MRGGWLLTGLLCALSLSVSAQGLRYRVEGTEAEVRDNIAAYLGAAPEDLAAAERFVVTAPERAGRALEALGIYDYDIELSVERERDPWRAVITVTHAPPVVYDVVDSRLVGPGADDEVLGGVLARLAPRPGDVAHHGRYAEFKEVLLRRARERGYFDAAFSQSAVEVRGETGRADARLVFETGERFAFGAVSAPEELLAPNLLASLQPFAEGEPWSQGKLLELRASLLRLGFFDSVIVAPEFSRRQGTRIPVKVELQAAPRHSYEVGAGFSTDTRQRLSLVWSSPRLNRWGHSQQTRLRYSPVNPAVRTLYSVPLDDPSSDLLQFGARLEDNEYGDLESRQRELLVKRETSKGLGVRSMSVRALRESWSVLNEGFDATYALAGVSFSKRNRSGSAVDPDAGLSQYYALEGASAALGSDQDLLRFSASLTAVRRFGEHSRVVLRGNAGYLFSSSDRPDELPPSLAFFAGGDNSIRGYAYQSVGREISGDILGDDPVSLVVGGTRLLTASVEYQRYLFENWRASIFVDAGDAFVDSDMELSIGAGFGVHYLSPLGALRVEIANPVSESGGDWRLHINIGAEL